MFPAVIAGWELSLSSESSLSKSLLRGFCLGLWCGMCSGQWVETMRMGDGRVCQWNTVDHGRSANELSVRERQKSKIYCNGRVDGQKLHSHCNTGNAQPL